jgi:hypothetical protein
MPATLNFIYAHASAAGLRSTNILPTFLYATGSPPTHAVTTACRGYDPLLQDTRPDLAPEWVKNRLLNKDILKKLNVN